MRGVDLREKTTMAIAIIGILLIGISIVFLRYDFLLDNFGQCYDYNDACCLKLGTGYFSKCVHVSMVCANKDEMPVFKGCDSQCKHIIECVRGVNEVSVFGDDIVNPTIIDLCVGLPYSQSILIYMKSIRSII